MAIFCLAGAYSLLMPETSKVEMARAQLISAEPPAETTVILLIAFLGTTCGMRCVISEDVM